MKLHVSNLGYITQAELDLRPMTVIIGPNNTGKTYLSYATYGLYRLIRPIAWPLDMLLEGARKKLAVDTVVERHALFLNQQAKRLVDNLPTFFQDSTSKIFQSTTFKVEVDDSERERIFRHFGAISSNIELKSLSELTALGGFHETPFLLPAERNALIITYKLLANRRYKIMKEAQRELFGSASASKQTLRQIELLREQGEVRYPQPVEDFLDFLTDIELEASQKKEQATDAPFQDLADLIEQRIQGRHALRFRKTRLGGQEIRVRVRNDLVIDLYNASSSIKQLTPLLLFLRHRAAPGQILMIDEPEMNLHPESQARLMEVLGILVSLGVRVLLTTHSPYIMAHLNNLVRPRLPKTAEARRKLAAKMYLQDPRSLLTPDQVSAYEVRDRTLRSLYDPDYGIRWGSLGEVSESLQQRYFQMAEQETGGKGRGKTRRR